MTEENKRFIEKIALRLFAQTYASLAKNFKGNSHKQGSFSKTFWLDACPNDATVLHNIAERLQSLMKDSLGEHIKNHTFNATFEEAPSDGRSPPKSVAHLAIYLNVTPDGKHFFANFSGI